MNFEIGDYQKQLRIAKKALEPEKQLTLPEAIDPFITEVIKHFRASADKNLLTPILGKLAQNCSTDMYVREEDGEVFIYIDYINTQDMVYIGHPKNFQKAVDANRVLQGYAEGQTKYTQKFDRGTTFGFYEIERIWELSISLHAKYGKVLPELQRAMQYWLAEKNEGSNDEKKMHVPRTRKEVKNQSNESIMNGIEAMHKRHKEDEEKMSRSTLAYMQSGYMRGTHPSKKSHRKTDIFMRQLSKNPDMQRRALHKLDIALIGPEMGLVHNLISHSWRTLEETEELTEYDWHKSMLHTESIHKKSNIAERNTLSQQLYALEASNEETKVKEMDDLMKKIEEKSEEIAQNVDNIKRAERFLKNNEEPKIRRKLHEKIGCEDIKRELEKMTEIQEWDVLASKEKEAIARIYSAIAEYKMMNVFDTNEDIQRYSYKIGTPRSVAESRNLNCLSSMWLFTTMLLKSGFTHNRIMYCNVLENTSNESESGIFGSHAALVITLSSGESILVDNGFQKCAVDFPLDKVCSEHQLKQLSMMRKDPQKEKDVTNQCMTTPMNIHVSADIAERYSGYKEFQLLEIEQAFGSMHMLHTGIDFEVQGGKEYAEHAYKMSLYYNPKNPDAYFRLGKLAYERGDIDEAENFFNEALSEGYKKHLISIYFLGLVAMENEEWAKAKELFTQVANDDRRIWGDDRYKNLAIEFAKLSEEELAVF